MPTLERERLNEMEIWRWLCTNLVRHLRVGREGSEPHSLIAMMDLFPHGRHHVRRARFVEAFSHAHHPQGLGDWRCPNARALIARSSGSNRLSEKRHAP